MGVAVPSSSPGAVPDLEHEGEEVVRFLLLFPHRRGAEPGAPLETTVQYLRPSRCWRSSESWKIRPLKQWRCEMGSGDVFRPRVLDDVALGSIQTFFADSQTALGMPSCP